jgi:hypothetical protein
MKNVRWISVFSPSHSFFFFFFFFFFTKNLKIEKFKKKYLKLNIGTFDGPWPSYQYIILGIMYLPINIYNRIFEKTCSQIK